MRPPSGFETFLRATGVPVYETPTALWYADSRVSLLNCPPGAPISPAPRELRDLILRARRPIVRYVTDAAGAAAWAIFRCDDRGYSLASLHPRVRTTTRRGLERSTVRTVSREELLAHGVRLAQATWSRQRRRQRMNERGWMQLCDAIDQGLASAWGAFSETGDLGSLAITVDDARSRHIVLQVSSLDGLARHASNALVFELSRRSLTSGDFAELSFGLRGFANDTLNQFKIGMGYRMDTIGMRVAMPAGLRLPLLALARPPLSLALGAVSSDLPGKVGTLLALSR